MGALDNITIGSTATKTVTSEMTVGHFVADMPQVYATPMMILHMEMASGSAIAAHLPEGFVSVGMDVRIRHRAATAIGRAVAIVGGLARSQFLTLYTTPVVYIYLDRLQGRLFGGKSNQAASGLAGQAPAE